jgi:soluble lytic murein transglycosylase
MAISRLSFFFSFTSAIATCQSPSAQPAPAALPERSIAEPAPRTFDPDVARLDAQIAALLEVEPAQVVERTRGAMERDVERRMRFAWIGARAAARAGLTDRALELFAQIGESDHPLARWARLERVKILNETNPALAADEALPLSQESWAGQQDARVEHAVGLARSSREAEAEPLLRALLSEAAEDSARASVAMPLAEILAARPDVAPRLEAVRLFRRVAMRAPLSRAARDSEERMREILAAIPTRERDHADEPTPDEAMARAAALSSAMRHSDAETAFDAIADGTRDEALMCRARLGQGRAIYNARDRGRAANLLSEVARDCEEPDVRAWAHYLAGRGFSSAGEHERALREYAALERAVPDHRLADDARFRSALVDIELGETARMNERLRTLPVTYPQGDMRGDARFILAWSARGEGRLADALAQLDASIAEGANEEAEDIRGRAAYWRACVLSELGRDDEARAAWTSVVEDLPLSYYSQQAIVRLSEQSPAAAEQARAALGGRGETRLVFPWRAELDTPAFGRAIELLAVDEVSLARRELAWVYQTSSAQDEELRWIEAALLDRAGAHPEAVTLTRRELRSFLTEPPAGDHYAKWRIAYPQAYAPLIDDTATARDLPPALVRAIAREESSFNAGAVSVAHAYGLTQLIVPTARRFGRPLGLTVNASTLVEPGTNVAIGTQFMAWLWERYEPNPALLVPAYNAGQGAVDRWMRERPRQRLDEWIENIPYDETRRYSRRVLQSWGTYAWLDRGELPALNASLPASP